MGDLDLLPPSKRSIAHTVHGHTRGLTYSPTYHSWQAMLARCRYLARDTARKHIGRGITVCEQWLSFETFLSDMGERPIGKTLDRIDNDKGYAPGNCRWATPVDQARNRRNARLDFQKAVDVAVARLRGETCASISLRFGISESLPREIVAGRTWKDASQEARRIIEQETRNA